MIKKELQLIIKRASVDFNEDKHTYQNRKTGEFYTGCTTISDAWDKSFFLGPWYAKEMYLALAGRHKEIADMTAEDYEKLLISAKGSAKEKGEIAKENGKLAHAWIERNIGGEFDETIELLPIPENEEVRNAVYAFINWKSIARPIWLASEEVLASDIYRIAGTLDGLAIINGIPTIVDFKTSSRLSASALLQVAGYDLMLDEMGFSARQYLILRLPKDGKEVESLTINDRDEMKFFKETFLKQREAHKFYVYAENKLKDKNGKIKVDKVVKAN